MNRPWVPATLLAALCLLMAVLVTVLTQRQADARQVDAARLAALQAAPRIAREVLSYDYRTIDHDIGVAQRDSTGAFARQYTAAAAQLESAATADRAIVQARPQAPGIVSASAHTVVVLVFVDQVSVRQPQGAPTPITRAQQSRVEMTLHDIDGTWRLAALSAL